MIPTPREHVKLARKVTCIEEAKLTALYKELHNLRAFEKRVKALVKDLGVDTV